MGTELAVQAPATPTLQDRKEETDLIIQQATYWAKSLMDIVEKCGMSKNLGGKKYLEVEGWLMIGEFAHVRAVVEWVREWKDTDESILKGYEARVQLFNDADQVVGAGESSCGLDAFPCRGKQGTEKDKAAKSAAQTWATSRALRNKFSYVAKIAGYQAVPAEEMTREDQEMPHFHQAPREPIAPAPTPRFISDPQRKRLYAIVMKKGIPSEIVKNHLGGFGYESSAEITRDKYDEIVKWAEDWDAMNEFAGARDDDIPDFKAP